MALPSVPESIDIHDDGESGHHGGLGRYTVIWLALLGLTIATVVTSRLDLGPFHLAMAMLIATGKASLVVFYFMHMAEQRGGSRMVLMISILFVLLMMGGVIADVATRFPLSNPPTGDQTLTHHSSKPE